MIAYGGRELAKAFRTVRGNTVQIAEDIPEDQYDFEGHQFLGFWDIESHRASLLPIIPPSCLSWVDNGSFRSWRDRTNMGGDYFVYSDVKQEAIDPPIVFYCPSGALQT